MNEIKKLLELNYNECCEFLIKKYGQPKKNYFSNETCKYKSQGISRGNEGLYIHHIDEDKAIMLSVSEYAIKNPFSYQLANRLVYCNLLEHLVLHIKIMEYPNEDKNRNELVGQGGVFNFMVPELNDIYSGIEYKQSWRQKSVENVINQKNEYFLCLKHLITKFDFPIEKLLRSFNVHFNIWKDSNSKNL